MAPIQTIYVRNEPHADRAHVVSRPGYVHIATFHGPLASAEANATATAIMAVLADDRDAEPSTPTPAEPVAYATAEALATLTLLVVELAAIGIAATTDTDADCHRPRLKDVRDSAYALYLDAREAPYVTDPQDQ